MSCFAVRTDLALEEGERVRDLGEKIHGVVLEEEEHRESRVRVTRVKIETKNGSRLMGKPVGTYVTLEAPSLAEQDEGYHREVSEELACQLRRMMPGGKEEQSVLVVGLGNRAVTADSLGPRVADQLFVNRHVMQQFGKAAYNREKMHQISCLVPGVMAQTGMESAEIIRGVVRETQPDFLIVVDALAARSTRRLNRTVQISDSGIYPGSGVGNHRSALNRETMGVPVLSVGVPTVVDAATIVGDAMEQMERENGLRMTAREHPRAVSELNNMYVTGKDIDEMIRRISYTVSEGLNIALDPEREVLNP
ncbi:MAG: GPR endopeptidase [Eubacteriales bacterium]|nr:GPR endopeptidase [Eubacteriales bacterium]